MRNKFLIFTLFVLGLIISELIYIHNHPHSPWILYNIALASHKYGKENLFIYFMNSAYKADPTVSYPAVELANYHYLDGNLEKTFEILENCKKIPEAAKHCGEILNYFSEGHPPFEIGFLSQQAEKIYQENN